MEELIKIRDMAAKYDISARTLRCYKDMGLIPVPALPTRSTRMILCIMTISIIGVSGCICMRIL